MNIITMLDMAKNCFPDRHAITSGERHLTYQDIFNLSASAAERIRNSEAENVSFIDISSPALPIALFASAWVGKPFAPLNYRLSSSDISELLNRLAPALVVCGQDYMTQVAGSDDLKPATSGSLLSATAASETPNVHDWDSNPEETAILLFTSGTTGGPKAAILRHRNLCSYVTGSVEFMSAGPEEAILTSVPPYHIAAMANLLSSIYAGRRIVQLPNFDADKWIDLVKQEKVTHAMLVPTMLARIADRLEARQETLPTLTSVSYGGGKTSRPVVEKILQLLPDTNFVNAYGLTETSSTVSILGPKEHREAIASDDPAVRSRLGSAGRPLPTLEVSIRNHRGQEISSGISGEIWIRGDQVSGEYKGRHSQLTEDGWFKTNDGGHFDEAGYLYVEGRLDDVIIKGGENISPGEIEDVIVTHSAVSDVAVVGVSDRDWGELIIAMVVLQDKAEASEQDIIDYVRDRLRSIKSPDRVVFRDELPYNSTGKLLRNILREELASS